MTFLQPVVSVAFPLLLVSTDLGGHCGLIRARPIGGDYFRKSCSLQRLFHEGQRGLLVPCLGNVAFEHLTLPEPHINHHQQPDDLR